MIWCLLAVRTAVLGLFVAWLLSLAGIASAAQDAKDKPERDKAPRVETAVAANKSEDSPKSDTEDVVGGEVAPSTTTAGDAAQNNPVKGSSESDTRDADFVGPLPAKRDEPASGAANNAEKSAVPPTSGVSGTKPTAPPVNAPPDRSAAVPGSTAGVSSTAGLSSTAGPLGPSATTPPALPGTARAGPGFPDFAKQQPGFIPDEQLPESLFSPAPSTALAFDTALGPSKLPSQDTQSIISNQAGAPSLDLPANFARVVVPTGTIQGSTESKQFHIEGGLLIYYSDVTISGDTADIDEKSEIAIIKGNVTILDPKYTLKTDELRIMFEDKQFEANGFVQFTKKADPSKLEPDLNLDKKGRVREYFAGQNFELYCGKLFYNWDTKEMTALTGVRLVHPSFNGTMERIDYNDKTKRYEMLEKVQLEITDYDWVFKTKVIDEKDEKKIRALTDGNTKVICERMVYSEETSIGEFYAKEGEEVTFEQPKRSIKASYIEVNDKTKDFYAEGVEGKPAVYTQKDGEWLYQAELIKKETAPDDVQNALKSTLTAKSGTITFNYDRKRIELLGGVTIEGSGTTITAGELIQDETAKFFLLKDNVYLKPNADSEVRAAQVYVDTANDILTFVGLVQGKTKSDDLPATGTEQASGQAGTPGGQPGGVQPGVFRQSGLPGQNTNRGGSGTNVAENR